MTRDLDWEISNKVCSSCSSYKHKALTVPPQGCILILYLDTRNAFQCNMINRPVRAKNMQSCLNIKLAIKVLFAKL